MTKKIVAFVVLMAVFGGMAAFADDRPPGYPGPWPISSLADYDAYEEWERTHGGSGYSGGGGGGDYGFGSLSLASQFAFMGTDGTDGLTFGIDGFGLGNLAAEGYELAGKAGQGSLSPKIRYDMTMGKLALSGQFGIVLPFYEEAKPIIGIAAQGAYTLSEALNAGGYLKIEIPTEDNSDPLVEIAPWIKFTKATESLSIYGKFDLGITIVDKFTSIGTGSEDHLTIGLETKTGISCFLRPHLTFAQLLDGEAADDIDVLSEIELGGGYVKGPLELGLTVGIPTVEDGMKYLGLSIDPRLTYAIKPNIKAYLDLLFSGVGSDGDVGVSPTIGGTFSL